MQLAIRPDSQNQIVSHRPDRFRHLLLNRSTSNEASLLAQSQSNDEAKDPVKRGFALG
jgi:hypothetical protein